MSETLPFTFTPEGVSVAIPSVKSWVILEVGTVSAVPALPPMALGVVVGALLLAGGVALTLGRSR